MPDINKARNWKNGKTLLISYEAVAMEGKAEFKDFKAEIITE
jgi:hypothetical protein